MFGVEKSTVIAGVEFEDDSEAIVVSVRPGRGAKQRCGVCQRRCPRYDQGEGRRRWRGPDLGLLRSFLEADAPRVTRADDPGWGRDFPPKNADASPPKPPASAAEEQRDVTPPGADTAV